jgi:hypothetical protein
MTSKASLISAFFVSGGLPATGVTANTYGNTASIPIIAVDSTGRITNASTISVSGSDAIVYAIALG